jgi:hypothetical protein
MSVTAHQRIIRDELLAADPRPISGSLAGYSVETVSRLDAQPIIDRYEWLGTMGNTTIFVALVAPDREIHGVSCFGHGPSGNLTEKLGGKALCLERGACVHYAPRNSASFLISGACRLVGRVTGIKLFYAYADPMAGEYGAVYQAAGWVYLGQGLGGDGKERSARLFVLPPGADASNPANWKTTRELRRPGRWHLSLAQARAEGWQIAKRAAKHVYATNVGRDHMAWRRDFTRKYPAPQPDLKLITLRG